MVLFSVCFLLLHLFLFIFFKRLPLDVCVISREGPLKRRNKEGVAQSEHRESRRT